ncbi:hypothetical protein WH47_10757 [Habropoda laboriosa]|uniref:Uncharacterized protein n=1 Tax=Habropoda laboriosa TaxID=597456 RepID=A0A0L7RFY2_9HYME|nr:hypothetical protein WH47_10757 [Habropoda laboriosa]
MITDSAKGNEPRNGGLEVFERRPCLQRSPERVTTPSSQGTTPPKTEVQAEPRVIPTIVEGRPMSAQITETPKAGYTGEARSYDKFLLRKMKKLTEIMEAALTVNKRNRAYVEGNGNIKAEFKGVETRTKEEDLLRTRTIVVMEKPVLKAINFDTDSGEDTDASVSGAQDARRKRKRASPPGTPRIAKAKEKHGNKAIAVTNVGGWFVTEVPGGRRNFTERNPRGSCERKLPETTFLKQHKCKEKKLDV